MSECYLCHKKLGFFEANRAFCHNCFRGYSRALLKLRSSELARPWDWMMACLVNRLTKDPSFANNPVLKQLENADEAQFKSIDDKRRAMQMLLREISSVKEKLEAKKKCGIEFLESTIGYYRKLGFFGEFKKLSNKETVPKIMERAKKEEVDDVILSGDKKTVDDCLVLFDQKRCFEAEQYFIEEDKGFVHVIKGLAKISLGTFSPQNIKETWESENGPIKIEFTHKGKKVVLKAEFITKEWGDVSVIKGINALIEPKGYVFALFNGRHEMPAFMLLKTKEKKMLEKERGWEFLEKN